MRCDLLGAPSGDVEAEGRHPSLHRRQAVELDAVGQAVEEPLPERALVRDDRLPADRVDVVDRGDEAGQQLVLAGAELVAVPDGMVRGRTHLVRPPRCEQVLLAERHPHVRPVELVRRAEEDVDVPGGDVDRPVRAVVNGVGPRERPGTVGEVDDPPDVGCGADRVGGDREGDDARPVVELRGQAVVVEREVVVHVDPPDDDAEVLLQREPGRHVPVVVELRHEHLVTRLQLACERAREEEVERGHALAECHLVARAAEERTGLLVGEVDERRAAARRLEGAADVRVVVAEVRRRSRRSPRRGTACRRGRRRTRAGAAGR